MPACRSRISRVALIVPSLILQGSLFAESPIVPSRITQPVNESQRTVLQGNIHPWARPQFDRGLAPPDLPMHRMLLVLKRSPEQEAALETLLDDQQDKASPHYHRWLTPEEFGRRFGPNEADIQVVTFWLEGHGFEIAKVAKGGNMIEFSGNAGQVQEAFHTAIHRYVVNGEEHWANATEPEIPTALAPVVAGVHTLHNFIKKPMIRIADERIPARLMSEGPGKAPRVTFPGTPPVYALGPADYWEIYNAKPLFSASPAINGQGSSVAVVGRSDLFAGGQDVSQFQNVFNIPFDGYASINTLLDGPDPGDLGGAEEAEATLDVTWSSALAWGAAVNLVVSATTNTTDGADLSELYIVDNNLGDVMTESFGGCEAGYNSTAAQGYATLAEQAAAQGITYLVATGDSGAEGCDNPDTEIVATGPLSVSILAATPFDVAVGGTMFNENGQDSEYWRSTNDASSFESALSYIPEDVWNESCTAAACGKNAGIFAGGGGASSFFAKPTWQAGVSGIPSDGKRDVPDVSLTAASHDPYLLCLEGSCVPNAQGLIYFAAVAGTSASTPSFAGIMALVNQKMNNRQGQADYVLYRLAAAERLSSCNASKTSTLPASTCIFNDVTVGNNAVPGEVNYGTASAQYQAGVGYDLATGLGSVNIANLINQWNSIRFSPTTSTVTSVTPTSIIHGQTVDVDLAVTPNSGTGTPSGSVSVIANIDGGPKSVGVFPLAANATADEAISSLPGGFYSLSAQYSGDTTFAPSPLSAPSASITVSAEPSTTALSVLTLNQSFNFVPFTGGAYGGFVYLRADIIGQSGQGIPTGSVNFLDGVNSIGTYVLNSQGNTATPNFLNSPNGGSPTGLYTLAPGVHTITADYFGDPSFAPSSSSPVSVTVTQAATSSALSTGPAVHGSVLTATVSTASGGKPPSGTVTFYVNGGAVGTPVAVTGVPALTTQTGALQGAQATASYSDTALVNGAYAVRAIYGGDTNYLGSSASATFTQQSDFQFSVEKPAAISIAAPGGSGTLGLTITALDGYTGTVNFSSSTCSALPAGASCSFSPASITGSGSTVLTVTTTAAAGRLVLPLRRRLWWVVSTGAGLASILLLGGCSRRRVGTVLLLTLCAISVLGTACGGGGGSSSGTSPAPPPSTPTTAGISTVVITATSGQLVHKVSFTLTVE